MSVFFNHLYYNDEVEHDIEIEGKRRKTGTTKSAAASNETYFRYRNTKSYGFTLENYSFELLL